MTSDGGEVISLMPVMGIVWIVVLRATRSAVYMRMGSAHQKTHCMRE